MGKRKKHRRPESKTRDIHGLGAHRAPSPMRERGPA